MPRTWYLLNAELPPSRRRLVPQDFGPFDKLVAFKQAVWLAASRFKQLLRKRPAGTREEKLHWGLVAARAARPATSEVSSLRSLHGRRCMVLSR